jgi:hypothetical protein
VRNMFPSFPFLCTQAAGATRYVPVPGQIHQVESDDEALIAHQLRRLYDAYAAEPVPQALLDILNRARA